MVDFKKGDRVRGKKDHVITTLRGKEATVVGVISADGNRASTGHIYVDWDHGGPFGHPAIADLELITRAIDTTKPLELVVPGVFADPVPFITLTSEGHILVGKRQGQATGAANWHIFTAGGDWVRSESHPNWSSPAILRNKPLKSTEYAVVMPGGALFAGYGNRDLAVDSNPGAVFVIRIHKTDGVVTNVDTVKP